VAFVRRGEYSLRRIHQLDTDEWIVRKLCECNEHRKTGGFEVDTNRAKTGKRELWEKIIKKSDNRIYRQAWMVQSCLRKRGLH